MIERLNDAAPRTIGIRRCAVDRYGIEQRQSDASALREQARPGDVSVAGVVELAEISGSDTFMHAATPWGELVAQLTGVHYFELGAQVRLHLNPAQAYVFGADEALVLAPQRAGGR